MDAFHIETSDTEVTLRLAGEITIEHARPLLDALAGALTPSRTVAIDATEVTRLDAAALQVLLAAARFASHAHLTGASAAWQAAFDRYASTDPLRSN